MSEHEWREYKPKTGAAARVGITHVCPCGAAKGDRPYKANKPCELAELRADSRECRDCFHIAMVTQAFTRYVCAGCSEEKNHHNGDTPAYCLECSQRLNCCRKCGKTLEAAAP